MTSSLEPGVLEQFRQAVAGRYRVDRELGHGAMATVFLAEDLRQGRPVAIKILPPELATVVGPERFLREIRITARLTHPNILPLHDSDTAAGLLYYVMPFVRGESLKDRIQREGPLPLDEALRIATEVAGALEYAHREGVIHRDVKPANILLADGHALVADFGLAKAIGPSDSAERYTDSGLAVGTPEYMSPEQAGPDAQVDGRTDQYALGCVLFEMLVGDPPFRGSTAHNILARHRSSDPPSARVVRPDLPQSVEQAIRRSLAKIPADRFKSLADFAVALTPSNRTVGNSSRVRWGLFLAGAVALALVAFRLIWPPPPPPDSNKVVVFPLVERGAGIRPGVGQEIALMIGSALEHTDPLKWIDGWTWLDPIRRADASRLESREAQSIARSRGARYYLDGVVLSDSDSSRVVLRLNDAAGDSLVTQVTIAGPADSSSFPQLGLHAINLLLPRLLGAGRSFDLAPLARRRPAAIANWLQGEREYRRSRYGRALEYQRRAVEADSGLAYAALKGALAADWEHEFGEATRLIELALRNDSLLPPRYVHFAMGLKEYFAGQADSATTHLQQALKMDSTWSEAWMALGEVRHHLFSTGDSSSASAFERARQADPDFAPPLFHLAEMALRDGKTQEATRLIDQFRRNEPDSLWLAELILTLNCLRNGPQAIDWRTATTRTPVEVVMSAKVLSSRGIHPACAEAGFRSVFSSSTAPLSARWGAALGLQGILTAEARLDEVNRVLDSAVTTGLLQAKGLYIVQAAAGHGMDSAAAAVIAELGSDYDRMPRHLLWYQGVWSAHRKDRASLLRVARALKQLADTSPGQLNRSTANGMAARVALLDHDTTRAIALLRQVIPAGDFTEIDWGIPEPLGPEQLLLAQLLLATGDPSGAIIAAARLEHPYPIIYLVYLRQSLELRATAAEVLGVESRLRYRERLATLR